MIRWDGHSDTAENGADVFEMESGSNVDSVFVGPNGNIYVGNFGPDNCLGSPKFGVYGYNRIENLIQYGDNFLATAGAVIIPEQQIYYHLDSCQKQIHAFTWDPVTDDLCEFQRRSRWGEGGVAVITGVMH